MTVTTQPHRRRARLARCVAVATVLCALSVVAGTAAHVSAQTGLSQGCAELNSPNFDGLASSEDLGFPMAFSAGETITVRSGEPTDGRPPTVTELYVDIGRFGTLEVVDSGGFPATVRYTMPADGAHRVGFRVDAGQATWQASCAAPLDSDGDGVLDADEGELADTGGADGSLIIGAVLAVVAGGFARYVARRRVA